MMIDVAQAELIFQDSFEGLVFESEGGSWRPEGNTGTVVRSHTRYGENALKSYINYDTSSSTYRTEVMLLDVKAPWTFKVGETYWIGFSIKLDRTALDAQSCIVLQIYGLPDVDHGETYDRNPHFAIYVDDDGEWYVIINGDSRFILSDKKYESSIGKSITGLAANQWFDFVIQYKFSYRTDGFVKIWINDEAVLNYTGIQTCFNDERGSIMKMGAYKFPWRQNTPQEHREITVYHDEIRIGDENSSYKEVAPRGVRKFPSPTVKIGSAKEQ